MHDENTVKCWSKCIQMYLNRIHHCEINSYIHVCKPLLIHVSTAGRYVVCQHKPASLVSPYLLSSKYVPIYIICPFTSVWEDFTVVVDNTAIFYCCFSSNNSQALQHKAWGWGFFWEISVICVFWIQLSIFGLNYLVTCRAATVW